MGAKILVINPKGQGDLHELRARRLTRNLNADITFHNVDRSLSYPAASKVLRDVVDSQAWDLIYQESTGIIGGANLIRAARTKKRKFIVSSGDPIGGFFHVTKGPAVGTFFDVYERMLYRSSAAFVGWTPYLSGAAIKLGAPKAVTIEGAVDLNTFVRFSEAERAATKEALGLNPRHLVCGVVGSLRWNPRHSYSYGLELVEVLKRIRRTDVSILIVGDGNGKSVLEGMIPESLKSRAVFTGRLPETEVVRAMNAMDIGFITQTMDQLGSFRLTTKLPEYLACGLGVAMSPIPGFYDYAYDAGWALRAAHPASSELHAATADWLDTLSMDEVRERAARARGIAETKFDYERISAKFHRFVEGLLDER